MTHHSDIVYAVESSGLATLTLNRPEQHNAFNAKMILSIIDALSDLSHQPHVKMLVIRGAGQSFCSGGDLKWMQETAQYTQEENERDAKHLGDMMFKLAHFNKPTLAVVQGPAYGGGIGIIACCNMAIASTNAQFCFSEVRLGLIPAIIGPYIIKAIGPRQALAYFLSGKVFDANVAGKIGLCHEVVAPEKLDTTAYQWIEAILQGGPRSLMEISDFVSDFCAPLTQDLVHKTAQIIARLRVSPEGQEGLSAFLEKRRPNWIK